MKISNIYYRMKTTDLQYYNMSNSKILKTFYEFLFFILIIRISSFKKKK